MLDIVVSNEYSKNNGGATVRLYLNKGTKTDFKFDDPIKVKADGKVIFDYDRTSIDVADINGDGRKDLVLGNGIRPPEFYCNLFYFENAGTDANPVFKKPVKLQDETGKDIKGYLDVKPYMVDWNNDGKIDILLGHQEGNIDIYLGDIATGVGGNKTIAQARIQKKSFVKNGILSTVLVLKKNSNVSINFVSANGRTIKLMNTKNINKGRHLLQFKLLDIASPGAYLLYLLDNGIPFSTERILLVR